MSLKRKLIYCLTLVSLLSMSSYSAVIDHIWFNKYNHAAYLNSNAIIIETNSGSVIAELKLEDTNPTFFALVWNSIKDKGSSNSVWFEIINDNSYRQIYKIHVK